MNPELERLIEKHIDEVSGFRCTYSENDNYYSFKGDLDSKFYDIPYIDLQVTVNNDKVVLSVSIIFIEVLDRTFYNEMVKCYGYPNNILAIDKLEQESKSEKNKDEDFNQILAKRSYSTKEVAFEDKPVWTIWKKGFYEISMEFYYKENRTQIIF